MANDPSAFRQPRTGRRALRHAVHGHRRHSITSSKPRPRAPKTRGFRQKFYKDMVGPPPPSTPRMRSSLCTGSILYKVATQRPNTEAGQTTWKPTCEDEKLSVTIWQHRCLSQALSDSVRNRRPQSPPHLKQAHPSTLPPGHPDICKPSISPPPSSTKTTLPLHKFLKDPTATPTRHR
jgi:hypothetical protein